MPPSPADFLFVERSLTRFYSTEVEFYEVLYQCAGRLVTVDALYVCLVQRTPEGLHFVFNREGQHFDLPESLPFGEGPTSRVAREGKPVLISGPEDRVDLEFVAFADQWTTCDSAIHWPLWIDADPAGWPDAVICVQAYATGAYDADAQDAVAWLAHRTEAAMRRRNREAENRRAIEAATLAASRNQAIADVRRFVVLLEELAAFRHEPARALAEIRRRQVELTQWAPLVPIASNELTTALEALSDRELEVLVYVAQGLSNESVAEVLTCSRHTVKRHLDNVYRETPLRNRAEVAKAADTIRMLFVARTGH